jgi:sugar phosphate isomerase/epimerase
VATGDLRYRMGTGPGGPNLEDGLAWAAENGFHFVDFGADHSANALATWDDERVRTVRQLCEQHDIHLGIHTLSAVNVAEFSPYMTEAVDAYLQANVDLGARLGVDHVITHAGLHQSSELELRKRASLEHLQRATGYAESHGVVLLLENLNIEPEAAEVHYMGAMVEELREYFAAIPSSHLKWGFSANHMHLQPGDFDSFVDALGVGRIGLVLVADNRGIVEEHLLPGQGTMDFARLFGRLEGDGYRGPYMLTFGNREQKLAGREYLLATLAGSGVGVRGTE